MLRCIITFVIFSLLSQICIGDYEQSDQRNSSGNNGAIVVAAAVRTSWLAYEFGDDSKEGKENISQLWGFYAFRMIGLFLEEKSMPFKVINSENKYFYFQQKENVPTLTFEYKF